MIDKDNEEQTCLMWAYEQGHDEIVTLLRHYRRPDEDFARGDYTPSGKNYCTIIQKQLTLLKRKSLHLPEIYSYQSIVKVLFIFFRK